MDKEDYYGSISSSIKVDRYCPLCMIEYNNIDSTCRNCAVCNNEYDALPPLVENPAPSNNNNLTSNFLSQVLLSNLSNARNMIPSNEATNLAGLNLPIPATFSRADAAEDGEMERIMARLLEQFGSGSNGAPPASKTGLEKLKLLTMSDTSGVTHSFLKVKGVGGEIIGNHATFLPPPPDETCAINTSLIKVMPFTCHEESIENAVDLKSNVAFVQRGVVSFAKKIMKCEKEGAICVIISQNVNIWPYDMTDSTMETKDCKIPAIIISQSHGERLEKYISESDKKGEKLIIEIGSRRVKTCIICQDDFDVGCEALQMPCQHLYHKDCLSHWLKIRNSCPICRFELETDDVHYENSRRERSVTNNNNSSSLFASW